MGESFLWWLAIQALGIAAFPIAALLLRVLPDRGYTAAKPLGLLIVGWLAYTLSMARLLPFGRLSLFLCLLVVAAFSMWLLLRQDRAILTDLKGHFRTPWFLRHVLAAELLFAVLFGLWAYLRAFNPDIVDQEKFMDFGILNSILKTGTLPPNDMWMAGQSLNYYYFGYALVAAVTALSGVATETSFNLANAALFGLTALMAYGVVYNLIQATVLRGQSRMASPRGVPAPPSAQGTSSMVVQNTGGSTTNTSLPTRRHRATRSFDSQPINTTKALTESKDPTIRTEKSSWYLSPILHSILAALMVVAMGNLAVPFGKKSGSDLEGNGWVFCFLCQKEGYDYWWAPSRIIMDYRTTTAPDGTLQKAKVGFETINEFPAFSFVLGDMHPHVMALPFVLLSVTAAYALARRRMARSSRWRDGIPRSVADWITMVLAALIIGSLYPTNTWDYPTYLLVLLFGIALPYVAAARRGDDGGWRWARPYLVQAAMLIVLSLALFAPFHLTFKSFAGGAWAPLPENLTQIPLLGSLLGQLSILFLVNTADKTITGFLVIFGIFLVAILGWLGYELARSLREQWRSKRDSTSRQVILGIVFVVAMLSSLLLKFPLLGLLVPLIAVSLYLVAREPRRTERNMALGLVLVAAVISLAVEIVYLHDNFGNRMNTLFKFYYQVWVLWALAAAYGFWRTLQAAFGTTRTRTLRATQGSTRSTMSRGSTTSTRSDRARATTGATKPGHSGPYSGVISPGLKALAGVWAAAFLLLVMSALPYAWYGSKARNIGDGRQLRGLDGSLFLREAAPGDYEAIRWLNANAGGSDVVLECCRNEYDWPGRISAFTGIPTLIAWDNSHELLWRSGQPALQAEVGRRRQVVDGIYQGKDPDNGGDSLTPARLVELLNGYSVDYVVVGAVERGAIAGRTGSIDSGGQITPYAENLMKAANLREVFQSNNTTVYAVAGATAGPDVTVPTPAPPTPSPIPGQATADPNIPPLGMFDRGSAGVNRGQFNLPRGIARDTQGNFFVADTENKRIQKFDPSGKWLLAFGSKGTGDGQFSAINEESVGTGPGGLAVDAQGNVYVADTWNHRIQKFTNDGTFITKWGSFVSLADPNSATDGNTDSRFYGPRGVAIGPDGNVYVTDTGNKRVLIFDGDGGLVRKIDSGLTPEKIAQNYPFSNPGELNEPVGIAVDAQSNVYVADTNNRRIQKFDASGKPVVQWPVSENNWQPGPYLEPFLAVDTSGNIYATAPTGKAVLKFDSNGQLLGSKNASGDVILHLPTGITVEKDGKVFVVDTEASTVIDLGSLP